MLSSDRIAAKVQSETCLFYFHNKLSIGNLLGEYRKRSEDFLWSVESLMLKFQVKNDNIGVVVNKFLVETGKD